MFDRARLDGLLGVIADLAADNETIPIVVEGQRDVASLRALGCHGEIHVLHAGLPLIALAERLSKSTRSVILLTDWDRKGHILYGQLSTSLAINNVRLHADYRARLAAWLTPSSMQDVESLAGYVTRHVERYLGPDEGAGLSA